MATSIRMPWRSSDALVQWLGSRGEQWQLIAAVGTRQFDCSRSDSSEQRSPCANTVLTLADPQTLPLGEYRRSTQSQRHRGKFVLADRNECIGLKTQLLRSNRGKSVPSGTPRKIICADQMRRRRTETLPVLPVSRSPLLDECH